MVAPMQAQPGMQQALVQTPDGRGMRPPYPYPHHPPAPPCGPHSPLASAPPRAGQHVMMVLPHSPQVKLNRADQTLSTSMQKQTESSILWFWPFVLINSNPAFGVQEQDPRCHSVFRCLGWASTAVGSRTPTLPLQPLTQPPPTVLSSSQCTSHSSTHRIDCTADVLMMVIWQRVWPFL